MHGAAIYFAEKARGFSEPPPDLILASDFLNLGDWRALAPAAFRDCPTLVYFHENQFTYPISERAPSVNYDFGWINVSSALAADHALFNTHYHRDAFIHHVELVLSQMTDGVPQDVCRKLFESSSVFPVGIDFKPHERVRSENVGKRPHEPIVVWNHRWEHDKHPERMVEALINLKRRGVRFRADLCGQVFNDRPDAYDRAARELDDRLLHLGYYRERTDYLRALARADIVLSTARHEFFGVAVVEALFMGCLPVLPHSLSYPEIIPPALHSQCLYDPNAPLEPFLENFLAQPPVDHRATLQEVAMAYDWRRLAPRLDAILVGQAKKGRVH